MFSGIIGRGGILLVVLTTLLCLIMVSLRGGNTAISVNSKAGNSSLADNDTLAGNGTPVLDVMAADPALSASPEPISNYYTQKDLEDNFLQLFRTKNWYSQLRFVFHNVCPINNIIYGFHITEKFTIRKEIISGIKAPNLEDILPSVITWLCWQTAAIGPEAAIKVMQEPSFANSIPENVITRATKLGKDFSVEVKKAGDEYEASEAEISLFSRAVRKLIRHGEKSGIVVILYVLESILSDYKESQAKKVNFFHARCGENDKLSEATPKGIIKRKDIANAAQCLWQRIMLSRVVCEDKDPETNQKTLCIKAEFRNWVGRSFEDVLLHTPKLNAAKNDTLD